MAKTVRKKKKGKGKKFLSQSSEGYVILIQKTERSGQKPTAAGEIKSNEKGRPQGRRDKGDARRSNEHRGLAPGEKPGGVSICLP